MDMVMLGTLLIIISNLIGFYCGFHCADDYRKC